MPAQSADELFDVVDQNDRVIGRARRADVHARGLRHRAVHVLVFDPEGRLGVQRRSFEKDTLPGTWTTSCSGHVDAGEDYFSAARRELAEEIGIALVDPSRLIFCFGLAACRKTGMEFVHVYCLDWEGAINCDTAEIIDFQWLAPDDLNAEIGANRRKYAPSFRYVWETYQGLPYCCRSN